MWSFDAENTVDCSHRSWIEILWWKEVEFTELQEEMQQIFPPKHEHLFKCKVFFVFCF